MAIVFCIGLSFIFIGIAWAAHHDMFNYIQRTNNLLIMNLFFLLGIVLQPFSTALLADHIDKPTARTAALIYYGILLEMSIAYNAIWWYAVYSRLLPADMDWRLTRALSWEHAAAPILHAAALVTAMWSVALSFIPLGILYVFFALPRVSERKNLETTQVCNFKIRESARRPATTLQGVVCWWAAGKHDREVQGLHAKVECLPRRDCRARGSIRWLAE